LLLNIVRQHPTMMEQRANLTAQQRYNLRQIARMVVELFENTGLQVNGREVRVWLKSPRSTAEIAELATTMLPTIEEAQQAAKRTQSINNLKYLARAMLNYASANGRFPPAVSYTYRKDGEERRSEYPHSWRVAILPFLEQQALYNEYRFDEPWDSETNKRVVETVVPVFRSPHDEPSSTNTSYFVFTGPEALFHGEEGTRIIQITDGLSNTFMIVEAKNPVPWTKPEDIPYAADKPVPELGGWVPGEFAVVRADGSAVRVSSDIDDETLRALITKAGGEVIGALPKPEGAEEPLAAWRFLPLGHHTAPPHGR